MKVTLRRLERELRKMDPALKSDSDELRAGVLLLAGSTQRRTIPALTRFSGYPREFVRKVVANARANGIFTREGVAGGEWFEEGGGAAFWLDVCCALGLMQRVKN